MNFEGKIYRVNGIELNVVIAGKGPDVLLVHGFPDTHEVWRKQIQVLVDAGYRVIAPDTRGCGDSQILPQVADYRVEHLVNDLIALLDELKIDKVRLVAHDWGAIIGWQLVLSHPQRVERYIALSVGHPTAYRHGGLIQRIKSYYIWTLQLRGLIEWLVTWNNWFSLRLMTRYPAEVPQWQAHLSRPGRLTAAMNYYRANLSLFFGREYASARVPVFCIWSSGDLFCTEAQMIASERYVKGPWRYARVDGANHWLQLDAPEQVNPLLLDYLAQPQKKL